MGIVKAAEHRDGRHAVNRQLAMRKRTAGSAIVITEGFGVERFGWKKSGGLMDVERGSVKV